MFSARNAFVAMRLVLMQWCRNNRTIMASSAKPEQASGEQQESSPTGLR